MRKIQSAILACMIAVCVCRQTASAQTTSASTRPAATQATAFGAGDHFRKITVAGLDRTYIVHIPKGGKPDKPMPVVLALHGAAMTGSMMVWFTGLN